MLSQILRFILGLLFGRVIDHVERRAINKIKSKGITAYLKVLQGIRLSAIGIVSLLVVIQMLCLGFILMGMALLWLSPWDLETKIWALFALGAGLFFVPLLIFAFALSDRLWYRASGAEKMVDEIIGSDANDAARAG